MQHNTLIFFGAGATAQIGSPTTKDQETFLKALISEKGPVRERLKKEGIKDADFIDDIELTLRLLYDGDGAETEEKAREIKKLAEKEFIKNFKTLDKFKISQYLNTYVYPRLDWLALKSIGKFLLQQGDKIEIQDILTVLTKAAAENISLPTEEIFQRERKHTLPSYINYPERVKAALRAYKLLIFKFFKHKLKNINKTKYEKYRKFCKDLTDFFVTPADFSLSRKLIKSYKQENIVLPVHLATLNWDPIFPFLFMKACKRQNEKLIKQNKLVYLSYGYPFFVKKLKGKDSGWFIFEEDSAALIDIMTYEKRKCSLSMKILKFFIPHGLMNMRVCSRCNNVFLILPDDVGKITSNNIIDIFLLDPVPTKKDLERIAELKSLNDKLPSQIDCPICNTPTFFVDTFLEIQSMIKLETPPPVKKIYADYSLSFSKADHLVFIGYSFPKDDIPHLLSLLTMSVSPEQKEKKFTLILYEKRLTSKRWFSVKEAENALEEAKRPDLVETIRNVLKLAKKDAVRVNFCGFPDILEKICPRQLLIWSIY